MHLYVVYVLFFNSADVEYANMESWIMSSTNNG